MMCLSHLLFTETEILSGNLHIYLKANSIQIINKTIQKFIKLWPDCSIPNLVFDFFKNNNLCPCPCHTTNIKFDN